MIHRAETAGCAIRRYATLLSAAAAALLSAACTTQPAPSAEALARDALIVDTHIDVPYRLYKEYQDVAAATDGGDFDYPRAAAGGLDALFMSVYVPADVDAAGKATEFADGLIDLVERVVSEAPERFAVATCTDDVLAIKADGRIAMAMGMENGGPIAGSLEELARFRGRGIRYVTLAHSKSNHIADSSYDLNERWGGLSPFGRLLVPEMNRLGVMIDVSHVTDRAAAQVLELSAVPVIASHSSLRHFTPGFHRNMDDGTLQSLAANGGVIQINFGSGFLTAEARQYSDAAQAAFLRFRAENPGAGPDELAGFGARYREENPYPYADLSDVLDHIDRAVAVAGIDHVGLGSDYDGVGDSLPTGLKDVSSYPALVAGLRDRGYDEAAIRKILGGNLMRVWRANEAYAAAQGVAVSCRQRTGA